MGLIPGTHSKHYRGFSHAVSSQFPYFSRALRLIWAACPGYTASWLVLIIIQGLAPVLTVQFTKWTIDRAVTYIEADNPDTLVIIVPLVALALVMVVTQVLTQIIGWINTAQVENIQDHVKARIHEKAITLDLGYFEVTELYDVLYRAYYDAHSRPAQLLQSAGALFQSSITLIGMAVLLASYALWLLPFLLVTMLPAAWVVMKFTNRYNEWRLASTKRQRLTNYYGLLLTMREPAAEIRIFDLGHYYSDMFKHVRKELREERLGIERKKLLANLAALLASLLATGVALAWMGRRVIRGAATFGDFAAFYQIFSQSQGLAKTFLNHTGSIYQSMLFIENLFEFLDLQPNLVDTPSHPMLDMPLKESIRFDNVTFRYPGSARAAIKQFNWTIPAGKIVALVGENGEGKSTLMKLLCRLYDPDDGKIVWDGVDLRELPLDSLRREITILFQFPQHYDETVRRNISIGALNDNLSDEAIQAAAETAGADKFIQDLPDDYDTVLGKWFGGEELSGGEWQRLALARAFVRQSNIIILDEPTSAMDSWAELDWLDRFRRTVQGRTAILITHRFTTAMQADVIYVIKENQIIEHGTHDELLERDGHYAASWNKQIQGNHDLAQELG